MHYKVKKSENGQFYNVLVASNGKVLNSSETEMRHQSVLKNIRSQVAGHHSGKPVKVKDQVSCTSFFFRWRYGKVEKFGEKKLRRTK